MLLKVVVGYQVVYFYMFPSLKGYENYLLHDGRYCEGFSFPSSIAATQSLGVKNTEINVNSNTN